MPRAARAGSFLFSPADFRNDPAVLAMDPCERGAYVMLMCALWDQKEPGIVIDDDRVLATLACVTHSAWEGYRERVSKAFDTTSRPGFWIQKRMVETKIEQDAFIEDRRVAGRLGNKKRWNKDRKAIAQRSQNVAGSGSGSGSDLDSSGSPGVVPRLKRSAKTEAVARDALGFRTGLIDMLQKRYPNRDVESIAVKLSATNEIDHRYRNLDRALGKWVAMAEENGWNPRRESTDEDDGSMDRVRMFQRQIWEKNGYVEKNGRPEYQGPVLGGSASKQSVKGG